MTEFEKYIWRYKTSNVGDYTYSFTNFANYVINMMFPAKGTIDKDSQILDVFLTFHWGKGVCVVISYC